MPDPQPTPTLARRIWRPLRWVLLAMGVLALGCLSQVVCIPAFVADGILVQECPDGEPRQVVAVESYGLRRGVWSDVRVGGVAYYTTGAADMQRSAPVRRVDAALALVAPDGTVTPLETREGWDRDWDMESAEVKLPEVADGDYKLRTTIDTPLGVTESDAPLALYAPAKVHLLTDRPLYEPGNTMQFRAVVLRAADLSPIDDRPGRWMVIDPAGELLLEESAPAGAFGVVAGSFPLDRAAQSGTWTVRWQSGEDMGEQQVQVQPFSLPRFSVEAKADQGWHGIGDRPVLRGSVTYSSGAPVAGAVVSLQWSTGDGWAPPTEWVEPGGLLPERVISDGGGGFVVRLPAVPADLVGQARLRVGMSATDPAGDRATGGAALLFSQDPIQVEAVTELGDGLVEGFNNKVFLRATTPTGQPLVGTELWVRRAWDPTHPGERATTDEDGVAALQLDPGPPVNVVVPAPPVRPPPRDPVLQRSTTLDLVSGRTPGLGVQLALDRQVPGLEECARFVDSGERTAQVGLETDLVGRVVRAIGRGNTAACLAQGLEGAALGVPESVLSVTWIVRAPDLPTLSVSLSGVPDAGGEIQGLTARAALDARACLPADTPTTAMPHILAWQQEAGERALGTRWVGREGTALSLGQVGCVERILGQLRTEAPSTEDRTGVARIQIIEAPRRTQSRPQATTMLGYELNVQALAAEGEEDLGRTVVRIAPGQVPNIRLRAEPAFAKAGDAVTLTIIRGPAFTGELPEELWLRRPDGGSNKTKVDIEARTAQWTLPNQPGWYSVDWGGARALVYQAPPGSLSLSLTPDSPDHAPGDSATLSIETAINGQGAPAAVGLFGVDATLGQLVPLPGADNMDGLAPVVGTDRPAFGSLDGQALAMGRVRGANAAAATILRVSQVPTPAERDRAAGVQFTGHFDPVAALSDRFYVVLGALHGQARDWEKSAPADAQMHPATMAKLWEAAVDQAEAAGNDVSDAYGRRLRLHQLPSDLLALTAPRAVVVEGTRLPEDTVNWAQWVAEEQP